MSSLSSWTASCHGNYNLTYRTRTVEVCSPSSMYIRGSTGCQCCASLIKAKLFECISMQHTHRVFSLWAVRIYVLLSIPTSVFFFFTFWHVYLLKPCPVNKNTKIKYNFDTCSVTKKRILLPLLTFNWSRNSQAVITCLQMWKPKRNREGVVFCLQCSDVSHLWAQWDVNVVVFNADGGGEGKKMKSSNVTD